MIDTSTALSRALEIYNAAQLNGNETSVCFTANCAQAVMMRHPLGSGESRCCRVTFNAKSAALSARGQVAGLPVFPVEMDLGQALSAIGSQEDEAFKASVKANLSACPATCPRHRQPAIQE